MADDPYQILGVQRTATADEIRRAYRKLAKKLHPDLNPGDKAAEDRFKQVTAAHDLLSDPEKRARFDRGEIDAEGQERAPPRGYYREHAESPGGGRYSYSSASGMGGGDRFDFEHMSEADLGDIFGDFFSGRRGPRPDPNGPRRGRDQAYQLAVDFLDAVQGATRRLTLPDGRTLDVNIPPGLEDGQTLRLRGQGGNGSNGGPAGDALIEVSVAPHPLFRREGRDIHLDAPVTVAEAVLGARITVPTPGGPVTVSVPRHSETGTRLRLRGRGVPERNGTPAGDAYVTLRLVLGPVDEKLEAFLRSWDPEQPADPRAGMEGGA